MNVDIGFGCQDIDRTKGKVEAVRHDQSNQFFGIGVGEVDRQVRPVGLELGNQAGDEAVQEEGRAADPQRSLAAGPQPLEVIGGAQRRRADCPPLIRENRAGGCQLKRFAHTMEDRLAKPLFEHLHHA